MKEEIPAKTEKHTSLSGIKKKKKKGDIFSFHYPWQIFWLKMWFVRKICKQMLDGAFSFRPIMLEITNLHFFFLKTSF